MARFGSAPDLNKPNRFFSARLGSARLGSRPYQAEPIKNRLSSATDLIKQSRILSAQLGFGSARLRLGFGLAKPMWNSRFNLIVA